MRAGRGKTGRSAATSNRLDAEWAAGGDARTAPRGGQRAQGAGPADLAALATAAGEPGDGGRGRGLSRGGGGVGRNRWPTGLAGPFAREREWNGRRDAGARGWCAT